MRCEEVRERLDDYVDGALPEATAGRMRDHLQGCDPCGQRERALRRLLQRAAALPRSLAPGRDLWPGIERELRRSPGRSPGGLGGMERPRPGRFSTPHARRVLAWAMAATVAALVVTGSLLFQFRSRPSSDGERAATSAPAPGIALARALPAASTEAEILKARQDLHGALEARKASMAPATVEVIERNLRLIDQAIAEIQAALAQDPDNRELKQLLLASQRREIALLRTVTLLPQDT
jgi:hypothetical protein